MMLEHYPQTKNPLVSYGTRPLGASSWRMPAAVCRLYDPHHAQREHGLSSRRTSCLPL
jgi:hypothetical protein